MQFFLILFLLCFYPTSKIISEEGEIAKKGWCGQEADGYVSEEDKPITLSLNYNQGTYLVFSDDRTYEIAPDDRLYTAYWISPFPADFNESGDSEYPVKITNLYSDRSVRGKEVSTRETLRQEMEPAIPATQESQETTTPKQPKAK